MPNLLSGAFVRENALLLDFMEIIVDFDINIGIRADIPSQSAKYVHVAF